MRVLILAAALLPAQPGGYPLMQVPGNVYQAPPPVIAPARPGLPPALPLGYPLIPMPSQPKAWGK